MFSAGVGRAIGLPLLMIPTSVSTQIPVYRQHQPLWWSRCELGEPCGICQAHMANRKLRTRCPYARPTEPAFMVPARTACGLISDGLAVPIRDHKPSEEITRIQLTFSK